MCRFKMRSNALSVVICPLCRWQQPGRGSGVRGAAPLPRHSVQAPECGADAVLSDRASAHVCGAGRLQPRKPPALPVDTQKRNTASAFRSHRACSRKQREKGPFSMFNVQRVFIWDIKPLTLRFQAPPFDNCRLSEETFNIFSTRCT